MDEIFGKSKFSWKVTDLGRFGALNRSGVLAGAISMLCGAPTLNPM